MNWGSVPDWAMAGFAAATAYYAYQSGKSSRRVEWLIGALESHSTIRLRMRAKRDGLKVVAYDPVTARFPARGPLTGEEWPLETIYLALPPEFRASDD
jgi:hypothetical protein